MSEGKQAMYRAESPKRIEVRGVAEQMSLGFDPLPTSICAVASPKGYTGLSGFHKYWGKKPIECLGFLVERLTSENDIVLDPFVGSGLLARECAIRKRHFIGIDINPISIELARFLSDPPSLDKYKEALKKLEQEAKSGIDSVYRLVDGRVATHYLWERDILKEIWIAGNRRNGREVLIPSEHDREQCLKLQGYSSRYIRPLNFFHNPRINTTPKLTLEDLFTGRALRNIDLLLERISSFTGQMRRSLLLTLTASVGQMSNMVFAITGRGKTRGKESSKIEVGSWVIGYWRPPLHFEINTWNCFYHRGRKLMKALCDVEVPRSFSVSDQLQSVLSHNSRIALVNDDSLKCLRMLPNNSVAFILTDPPHSDRIPYLELSELWNSILGQDADFSREIVVSNAREREKTKANYSEQMGHLLSELHRVLVPGGTLALLFNARDGGSWNFLSDVETRTSLRFFGCFPMSYSANSVVQDNRLGAMKSDYVLLYLKNGSSSRHDDIETEIGQIPGWSKEFPKSKEQDNGLHLRSG